MGSDTGLKEPVDVAEYLFRRLHEVGIRSIHGVPGDYNLGIVHTHTLMRNHTY